jgi:hypothetical protein
MYVHCTMYIVHCTILQRREGSRQYITVRTKVKKSSLHKCLICFKAGNKYGDLALGGTPFLYSLVGNFMPQLKSLRYIWGKQYFTSMYVAQ